MKEPWSYPRRYCPCRSLRAQVRVDLSDNDRKGTSGMIGPDGQVAKCDILLGQILVDADVEQ